MTKAERVAREIADEIDGISPFAWPLIQQILEREYLTDKQGRTIITGPGGQRLTVPRPRTSGEPLTPVHFDVPRPSNAPPDVQS